MKKRNHQPKLKKLPIQNWQKTFALIEQGDLDQEVRRMTDNSFEQYQKICFRDGACLLSDGYYLQGDSSWFTFSGVRYSLAPSEKGKFLSILDAINTTEKIGSTSNVFNLAKLESLVHGSISEKTSKLLKAIDENMNSRKIKLCKLRSRNLRT